MRVLIADDSIVSRHLLDATLRKWGYDVLVAVDGLEAWEILRFKAPSLAILDWVMPGLTGPEVCKRVREDSRRQETAYTYLMILSSKSSREDLIEAMESGADDYLTKPFDQHELKVRLRAGIRILDLQRELVTVQQKLQEQATKDSLTRIWNRSSILEIFQRELSRSALEGRPVGVMLVDIDRFKLVNDTYGHLAGGEALQRFAARLLGTLRPYDSVGKFGGDEFLIILPGLGERELESRGDRLRAEINASRLELQNVSVEMFASLGAVCAGPNHGLTADELIRVADEAMYVAKRLGGDRFHLVRRPGVSAAAFTSAL